MSKTKQKTVTRAEVLSWPGEALTEARVIDDDTFDDEDSHHEAWWWINGDADEWGCVPDHVEVRSTRTSGEWVRVTR